MGRVDSIVFSSRAELGKAVAFPCENIRRIGAAKKIAVSIQGERKPILSSLSLAITPTRSRWTSTR